MLEIEFFTVSCFVFMMLLTGDSGEAERQIRDDAERQSGMIPNTIGA
jgi:hypothetical protein